MIIRVDVLDHGYVELLDFMGGDLKVVNAAKRSYGKRSAELTDNGKELIGKLIRDKHGAPFEHSVFSFEVKAPIFVVRQWMRHRIASYSEQSGRYTEMEPEFYTPIDGETPTANADAYGHYRTLIETGVSRERARIVLPLNIYTTFWFTVNARSLMNFLALRHSVHAQEEIREYATALEVIFGSKMPVTYREFFAHGRIAP